MKKILTILTLLSVTLSGQVTTQTVNMTSSVTAGSQTITTYTIKKDSVVSLQSFTIDANTSAAGQLTVGTTGILIEQYTGPNYLTFNLGSSTNFNINNMDSIRIKLVARSRSTASTTTVSINGEIISNSDSIFTKLTYTLDSIVGNLSFTISLHDASDGVIIDSLKISTYTHTTTITPTNTVTTSVSENELNGVNKIYSFSNKLYVIGDITEGTSFTMTDISGIEVIKSEVLSSQNELIDIPDGIYLVQVFNSKNTLVSYKKVLIQK